MPVLDWLLGLRLDDPQDTVDKLQATLPHFASPEQVRAAKKTIDKCLLKIKKGVSDRGQSSGWLNCLCEERTMEVLLLSVRQSELQGRFTAASIMISVLQSKQLEGRIQAVFKQRPDLIVTLMEGYSKRPEFAASYGLILRECLLIAPLRSMLLTKDNLTTLLSCLSSNAYDAASDAYERLRECFALAEGQELLQRHFDDVVHLIHALLLSDNYIARRQSLRLLNDIVLRDVQLMQRYVHSGEHLKIYMNLLRDKSKSIQYESFCVFQNFVVVEPRSKAVSDILSRNRNKLLQFLESFDCSKGPSEFAAFCDTKRRVIDAVLDICPTHSTNSSLVNVEERNN